MDKEFKLNFSLFDKFSEVCFILSSEGEIINCNKAAKTKIKDISSNFFDLIATEQQTKVKDTFRKSLNTSKNEEIITQFNINGSKIDVDLFFLPIEVNKDDQISERNFVIARDITKEKETELELLRFFNIAENTVNPLQITDLEGKMIYVNPAFIKVSGFSREELIGQKPKVFGSSKHSKKFWAKMWATINEGKVWVGEVENRKKNGEPFYTQLLISPIISKEKKLEGFFGIHRDLSEKRTLEKQLIHTQKMESIGTLAAGIAHEVGNPLASISALVQVAQRYTSDNLVKDKLELVKNQVNRISKIIRDLVDFSRPSNYELQLSDINKNIMEAVEITKVGVKAKDIKFETDLNSEIPLLPLISDQIQQVFVNILLNAVDALLESGHPDKKIEIKSDADDEDVIIEFSDNGKGIAEENMIKIFEPFFTTKKQGKGTGLGLWVSYGIIKSFQGNLKVKSELDKGTTFTINLPIHT